MTEQGIAAVMKPTKEVIGLALLFLIIVLGVYFGLGVVIPELSAIIGAGAAAYLTASILVHRTKTWWKRIGVTLLVAAGWTMLPLAGVVSGHAATSNTLGEDCSCIGFGYQTSQNLGTMHPTSQHVCIGMLTSSCITTPNAEAELICLEKIQHTYCSRYVTEDCADPQKQRDAAHAATAAEQGCNFVEEGYMPNITVAGERFDCSRVRDFPVDPVCPVH
jgi:hypothetical protein